MTYGYSGGNAPCTTANIFAPGGNTISFWLSTTTASTGIVGSAIGTTTLSAGSGNLDNVFMITIPASTAAGGYYLLANSNTVPTSYQYGGAIVVAAEPSFSISPTTTSPQNAIGEAGSGWDAAATVHVTISYADAPYAMPTGVGFTAAPVQIDSFTTTAAGNFPASESSNPLPELGAGTYTIVAQEVTAALPLSYITADATLTIQGAVGTCYAAGFPLYETCNAGPVAPLGMVASTSGTATLVHQPYLTGGGFAAGASITSITVGGVAATFTPAAATVAADGAFTVQITALASTIHTQGPATIVVVTSPASTPSSFPDAIVVSNPGVSTNLLATDLATGASNGASDDGLMYQGWGFAASTAGHVYFDGVARGETSDPNGYFLDSAAFVPYLPAGPYNVFADVGGYTATTTFTIVVYNYIFDSSPGPLTGEYAVAGSEVEVYAQSLAPMQPLDVIDTALVSVWGTSSLDVAIAEGYSTYSISGGHYNAATGTIQAASVGYVDIYYELSYQALATGTSETITLVTLPSASSVVSATYYAVGGAVTSLATSYSPTGTISLSISGLIPNGSAITPETAGYVGPFGITLDGSSVTFSSPIAGSQIFYSTATGTANVVFANIATNPVEELDIFGDVDVTLLYSNFDFISSTPSVSSGTVAPNGVETSVLGGAGSSGSPWLFYADPAGLVFGVVFDLYNFPASTAVTVTVWTSAGAATATVTTDANGGGLYAFAPPNTAGVISPPGSPEYLLTFSAASTITITGGTYYWELETAVAFNAAPFADTGGIPAADYALYFGADASVGGMVTVFVSNYLPNSPLNLVMTQSATAPLAGSGITDTNLVAQATTDANGDATFTFTVPPTMDGVTVTGLWYLYVVENTYNSGHGPFNINTVGLTIEFPDFNLFDGGILSAPAATGFPGEIVSFDWVPATLPAAGVPVSVTIELNGTAYTTMPATFTGTDVIGSFTMPNDDAGSSWVLSLTWTQVSDSGGNTVVSSYGSASSAPLALVNGAGALVVSVSITQAQIVQIATLSGQFVNLTLASLGAQITGINGSLASLSTQFGDMTAMLTAIGASVTTVENGIATITTQLGTVTASLTTIGAQIVALNQTVSGLNTTSITNALVQIQTTLGTVTTTLGAIDATVTSTATSVSGLVGSVATITTTLGTISGTITNVSNGIATIQTSLGTLQTSVNAIGQPSGGVASQNSVNTTMYLLYVVIVLAIIAIIVAAMAMMRAGRGGNGGGRKSPPAEYQGPSSSSSSSPAPKTGSSGGSSGGSP